MSKEFKNIDDLFRSELGGNTQKAPEFVKDNIDAALGFNKRRYGWLFTGLFVGIIVLTIGIVWLMNDSSFKQLAHTKLDSIGQEKDQRLLQTYDTKFDLESNLSTDLLDDGDLSSPSSMTDQLDQTDLNNNTTVNHQTNTRINGAIIPDIQVDKTKNKKAIDQGDGIVITTTQAEIVLKERDQGNSNEELMIEGLDTGNQETDLELAPTDKETEQKTEDKPINTKLSNGDTDNSMSDPSNVQKSTSEDQVNVVKQNQSDTDTTEIEASLEVPLAHNTVTDPSTPDSTINNAPIESKPDAYKPWMLSLSSGITKARTKYTSTDMIEETYYNNAITDGLGWQFNVDLTYRLPKGLTFGTGFGYTQLNASYDYPLNGMSIETSSFYDYEYDYELIYDTYLSTTIDSSEFVWEVEYVSDSTAYVVDSTLVTTIDTNTTTNTYTGRNKVGYFQIPVSIGTQMQFGKFQLDLFSQTRFNFLIQSNGSLIQDNSLFNYTTSDGIYRPFYMDVMLGMRLHYALFDRLYINANFQYRPVIGSAYQSTTLTKSFDYFHSGVGLSWRF